LLDVVLVGGGLVGAFLAASAAFNWGPQVFCNVGLIAAEPPADILV
jgi:2-polyprenyl-6-methoxyphenol hydroxylase-like FAD-dependent oxidoreductase